MKRVLQVAVYMLPVCAVAQSGSYSLQELGKYEIHQVKKGETLYSLSRKYNTTVPAVLELNPSIVNNSLKTGSTIKVPKQEPVLQASTENIVYNGIGPKPYLVPVYYEVAKGETLYSIGQKTQNDVEVIKLWNDLKATNIKPGQKLVVGYAENTQTIIGTPRMMPKPAESNAIEPTVNNETIIASTAKPTSSNKPLTATSTVTTKPTTSTSTKPVEKPKEKTVVTTLTPTTTTSADTKTSTKSTSTYNTSSADAKLIYVNEKGICTWTRGSSESGTHYALHPTAPIGSTVSVKNMMNNRSIQVKVIGRLPNTPENENVAIKISGSAAKELNALDGKFLVQLSYMGFEKSM